MLGLGGDEEEDPWAAARHERPPSRRHIPHDEQQDPEPFGFLVERFPATFFPRETPPRPLKIGIYKDLADALAGELGRGELSKRALRGFIKWYTHHRGYLKALSAPGALLAASRTPSRAWMRR